MLKKVLFILFIGIATAQAQDDLHKIEVIRVIDGDTIEIKHSVRLNDIDCYENKNNRRSNWQAKEYNKTKAEVIEAGKQSQQTLQDLINENKDNLYIDVKRLDRHKRLLGDVYIGNGKNKKSINDYMLKSGGCLPFKPQPQNKRRH